MLLDVVIADEREYQVDLGHHDAAKSESGEGKGNEEPVYLSRSANPAATPSRLTDGRFHHGADSNSAGSFHAPSSPPSPSRRSGACSSSSSLRRSMTAASESMS